MVLTLDDLKSFEQKKREEIRQKEESLQKQKQDIISKFDQKKAQEEALIEQLREKAGGLRIRSGKDSTDPRIIERQRNLERKLRGQRVPFNEIQARLREQQKNLQPLQEQFEAAKQLRSRLGILPDGRRGQSFLDNIERQKKEELAKFANKENPIINERETLNRLSIGSIDDSDDLISSIKTAASRIESESSRDFLKLVLPENKHSQINKLFSTTRKDFSSGSVRNRAVNREKFKLLGGTDASFDQIVAQEERDRAISKSQSASIKAAKANFERDREEEIFEQTGETVDVDLDVGGTKFELFGFTPESKGVGFISGANLPKTKKQQATQVDIGQSPAQVSIGQSSKQTNIGQSSTPVDVGPPETILPFQLPDEQTLSQQSGFDIAKQLANTKSRFGLDLQLRDIIDQRGNLLPEAKNIFQKNLQIEKLMQERTPVGPEIVTVGQNTDFDTLFARRESIVEQQQKRIKDIESLDDDVTKTVAFEQDLPLFKQRADELDTLIDSLQQREKTFRKTRKPQPLLSGAPESFKIKDLIDRRNTLANLRNQKLDEFEQIPDPALRRVTIEQDIPQFDERIFKIDADIDRGVKFAESRAPLEIGIQNQPTQRRGRLPKFFEVQVGDETRQFRRTRRGAQRAEQFFEQQSAKKRQELESIEDPVKREIAKEQDLFALDFGKQATKAQKKALKAERRQELEAQNIGGATGTLGFLPFTPSDTPTGQLKIPPPQRTRSNQNILNQIQGLDSIGIPSSRPKRGRGTDAFMDDGFDIGAVFGTKQKIPKKQKGEFEFF